MLRRVSPFGHPRLNAYVQLPVAYRSLSRPSSAPDAKAFPLRSFQLDLVGANVARSASPFREKLHPLHCSSSRSQTRFAGLCSRWKGKSTVLLAPSTPYWFSTVKNYAGIQREVPLANCFYPLKVSTIALDPLLLASHLLECFLHCSVFKVQLLTIKARFQYSVP